MSAYPKQLLGNILRRVQEPVAIDPHSTYKQVTVRLFHKGVVLRGERAGSAIGTTRQWLVRQGQVLLSRIDARNGAIGIVPPELEGAVVTNDFWAFEVNEDLAVPQFLDACFSTPAFVEACKAASEGTTNRVRLQPERFFRIEVTLPSLDEQRRVVSRIEELAAKIEEAHGIREDTTQASQSIMDAAIDGIFAAISEHTEELDFASAGGFVTSGPRGWGGFYNENGDRRLIRVENVSNRDLDLSAAAKVLLPSNAGDIGRSQVKVGDVLVTITGAIGRVGVVRRFDLPCHVSQHVALLRPPASILPDYLYWYLRSPRFGRSQTEGRKYGATKPGLDLRPLRNLKVRVPPEQEQRRIVAYLDNLQAKVDSLKKLQSETAAELDALMPSILAKAFCGELSRRLPDHFGLGGRL